ncbi:MAG TPA: hypothetical protein VFS65_02670 [Candidatus Saccharimonadales bacterium]|nr:hypothetical protein [Candidatus Saccharimonadales bacterium]
MNTMVYVALAVLGLAAAVFAVRTLRSAYRKKLSSMFADMGVASLLVFAVLVLAGVGTTTGSVLVAGSAVITFIIWAFAIVGGLSVLSAMFVETWVRSAQSWRVRHDNKRAVRLDKRVARSRQHQRDSADFVDQFTDDDSRERGA